MAVRFVGEGLITYLFDPLFENIYNPLIMKLSGLLTEGSFLHTIIIGNLIDGQIDYSQSFGSLTTGCLGCRRPPHRSRPSPPGPGAGGYAEGAFGGNGRISLHLGGLGSIAYTLYLGVLAYVLFAWARLTRNCWALVMWSFVAGMLALGWFEFYFWHLPVIEVPVYCAILALSTRLCGRRCTARRPAQTPYARET